MNGQLSDVQVENWRKVLFGIVGPYATFMSREDIQKFRDKMNRDVSFIPIEIGEWNIIQEGTVLTYKNVKLKQVRTIQLKWLEEITEKDLPNHRFQLVFTLSHEPKEISVEVTDNHKKDLVEDINARLDRLEIDVVEDK
jgi:hypothetical protein